MNMLFEVSDKLNFITIKISLYEDVINQIFFLKKPQNKSNRLSTVYLRLTIDGTRTEVSTLRQCDPKFWIQKAGRLSGKTKEVKDLNAYLDTIQHRIYEIYRNLVDHGREINGEIIKNLFRGISDKPHMLIEIFESHNDQFAELVGKGFAPGTLKKFKTALSALKSFVEWKFNRSDISLRELNHLFITDYEFYLKTVRGLQHNTAISGIKKLKKVVRQCVANDWLEKDPFMSYKIKIYETPRDYFLTEELNLIQEKVLYQGRLDLVRDIFLFSCFTGLSYSDVAKLTSDHIVTGIDGEKWIFINRTKTNSPSRIPLLPTAFSIIEKYANHPKVKSSGMALPILSNQRMNSYLKELADVCGINKEITFHCARHTFSTTVTLTNGVPIESLSKMLGHKSIRTTQIYAKVTDRKVSDDMKELKRKYHG